MDTSLTYHEQVTHITRKGQVTVPAAIRKALGLKEGDTVAFALTTADPAGAILRPAHSVAAATFGALASDRPMLDPSSERAAFEEGVADEVALEDGQAAA